MDNRAGDFKFSLPKIESKHISLSTVNALHYLNCALYFLVFWRKAPSTNSNTSN